MSLFYRNQVKISSIGVPNYDLTISFKVFSAPSVQENDLLVVISSNKNFGLTFSFAKY